MPATSPLRRAWLSALASVVLSASASATFAACPVAADLERGIALTRSADGFTTVYRKRAGVLTSRYAYAEGTGPVDNVTATYAHFLLPSTRSGDKGDFGLSYDSPPDGLDARLAKGEDWQSAVTFVRDGKAVSKGTFTVEFERKDRLALGKCSYPVWIVETALALRQSDPIGFRYAYAPSLGIPLESIRIDPEGVPINGVQYDTIRLSE